MSIAILHKQRRDSHESKQTREGHDSDKPDEDGNFAGAGGHGAAAIFNLFNCTCLGRELPAATTTNANGSSIRVIIVPGALHIAFSQGGNDGEAFLEYIYRPIGPSRRCT